MRYLTVAIFIIALASCSKTTQDYPIDPRDARKMRNGALSGDGGLKLFGKSDDENYAGGGSLAVNAFLWRATLDTLSFMPLASTDPVSGVILTDWYENPETPGERFKLNVIIMDRKLRSDGVKVSVYKQVLDKNKNWRDAKVDPKLGRDLENKILARARELKIASIKK